jgi:hypothetical protein
MGYVDKHDRMANSCFISCHTWKWTKKLFFHLVDPTVLNSWILLSSCGAYCVHRDFRLLLVWNLLEEGGRELHPQPAMRGRQTPASAKLAQLETRHNQPWPKKGEGL